MFIKNYRHPDIPEVTWLKTASHITQGKPDAPKLCRTIALTLFGKEFVENHNLPIREESGEIKRSGNRAKRPRWPEEMEKILRGKTIYCQ